MVVLTRQDNYLEDKELALSCFYLAAAYYLKSEQKSELYIDLGGVGATVHCWTSALSALTFQYSHMLEPIWNQTEEPKAL